MHQNKVVKLEKEFCDSELVLMFYLLILHNGSPWQISNSFVNDVY